MQAAGFEASLASDGTGALEDTSVAQRALDFPRILGDGRGKSQADRTGVVFLDEEGTVSASLSVS